jgi:hypothetical protein
MKSIVKFAGVVVLAASNLGAQTTGTTAEIQHVGIVANRDTVSIEIQLTKPIQAKVVNSDTSRELTVEFPGAVPAAQLRSVRAKVHGVKSVQVSLHRADPPTTWIVVALDENRPFAFAAAENKVTLQLQTPAALSQSDRQRRVPVPGAKSSVLGGLGSPKQDITLPSPNETASAVVTPPPSTSNHTANSSPALIGAGTKSTASSSPAESAALPAAKTASDGTADTTAADADASDAQLSSSQSADEPASTSGGASPLVGRHLSQPNVDIKVAFKVKYVTQGVAYLEGGRSVGLSEGLKLVVRDTDPTTGRPLMSADGAQKAVAELHVFAVAETSSASEIHDPTREVKPGDWAFLSDEDTASLVAQRSLSATRKYPVVVSFTEDDSLDEEARAAVPRPPLPEINRARGRIGFDYTGVNSPSGNSSNLGLVIRTDITRIYGTYWNLNGYWRGRINSQSSTGQPTLQDLINRTYHLGLTYDNPQGHWVAGFGRLYLPWATSLDTIDGGYFGRRINKSVIVGTFGGSTPDPTSWSYNPDRRLAGAFVNVEGGSFDDLRYTSTSGMGISMLKWTIDRPFVFFENSISYKHYLSIYHALQTDSPRGNSEVPAPGAGIGRSFFTVRFQPHPRVDFDFNHTYFRDVPTFDPQLVGTGLLDKYLFQGFSAGVRVEVVKQVWLYTNLGRSNRSGDTQPSLNQMYGITFGHLPLAGIRTDFRYSKFDGAFGGGSYKTVSFSRNFRESLRWEVLAGSQSFASSASKNMAARFVTGNFEANLGSNYFIQSGYTRNRGGLQNYDQWSFTFGYRFDSKSPRK